MKIQQIIYMDRDMEFEVIISKKLSEDIIKDDLDKDTIDDITENYDEEEYYSGEDALNGLLNGCDVWVRNDEAVYKTCIIDIPDINIIQNVYVLKTQIAYAETEISVFTKKPTYEDIKNTGVVPAKFIKQLLENNYLNIQGNVDFEDDETDDNWIYNHLIGSDTYMRISLENAAINNEVAL